jgi:hypothetical protein
VGDATPVPPQNRPRYLTPDQERIVRESWVAGMSRDEVARAAGITVDMLVIRLKDQLADLPRRGRGGNRRAPTPDPTPAEIRARAAILRRSWPAERYLPDPREPDPLDAAMNPTSRRKPKGPSR